MSKHPNALAAAASSALATIIIWLVGRYLHYHLNRVDGGIAAGVASTVALFIGRRGIRGTLAAIWKGGTAK